MYRPICASRFHNTVPVQYRYSAAVLYYIIFVHLQVAHELARCKMVVDRFHYDFNHTSKYCTMHCSPHSIPELRGANMEVCEQVFKKLGKYAGSFRYLNRVRFNFMLLLLSHKHNGVLLAKAGSLTQPSGSGG